ncbi:MAG: DUF4331 family protein [Bacteroidota bacterium]|nr:DUF4331 family protein [Bacteroidota bacterium]MDP4247463.1 DUF4331 family protein [Bacteroidota bacterium]MDP4260284.1 DUF4331 family protein [Bacteroidota bacterium]
MKSLRSSLLSSFLPLVAAVLCLAACKKDQHFPQSPYFDQADQMGRPAINTVFIKAADKDRFNQTTPSLMAAAFGSEMKSSLLGVNPGFTTNLLGLNADQFIGVLSTDVLNASTKGKTTFYDGTNVLTGRALGDDVIDVELTLVFGGPDGSANPGLTSDHVNGNDAPFLADFPYLAQPH